ncbi:hypothetical protein [Bordetella sp. LUAb4]|uniref:hypothetical protein n=1 Tax=Bordetella sp. LUAb4 TaxID=2843195 RepID=UPI001E3F7FCB|nr:hypothetical protein [Bordetella sp. LUAb4]
MIDNISAASRAATIPSAVDSNAGALGSDSAAQHSATSTATAPTEKQTVHISSGARAKAEQEEKQEANRYADIDASNLDTDTKDILKRIRDLERKLQEKTKEMQEVMSDKSLTEKQREQKMTMLRAEIGTLSGAISDATQAMNDSLEQAKATPDQRKLAASLIHA